ncbi:unnamed protein product [Pylaiella littoralis]
MGPKRKSWADPNAGLEDIDFASACDGVATPNRKTEKKAFGLGANGKRLDGGGHDLQPRSLATQAMGKYDRLGLPLSGKAGKGGQGGGSTMQVRSSGPVRKDPAVKNPVPPAKKFAFFGSSADNAPRAKPGTTAPLELEKCNGASRKAVPIVPGASLGASTREASRSVTRSGNDRTMQVSAEVTASAPTGRSKKAVADRARAQKRAQGGAPASQIRWELESEGKAANRGSGLSIPKKGESTGSDGSCDPGRGKDPRYMGDRSGLTSFSKPKLAQGWQQVQQQQRRQQQQQEQEQRQQQQRRQQQQERKRRSKEDEDAEALEFRSSPRKKKAPKSPDVVTIIDIASGGDDSDDDDDDDHRVAVKGTSHSEESGAARKRPRREDDWRVSPSRCKDESATGSISPPQGRGESSVPAFGSVPDMPAEAVMIGKWVVLGFCRIKFLMSGDIRISLKGDGDTRDTTLSIASGEVTYLGFSAGHGRKSKDLIAIRTNPEGNIAKDPTYRLYDPSDKGARGHITVFLSARHDFRQHEKSILDAVSDGRDSPVDVNTNLTGELPDILRRNLDKHLQDADEEEEDRGRLRARRTLRSGGGREKLGKVLFHYPPESSASDRVGINSLDEARTQEGEFLNDSLVDLYLKHMHKEAFLTWQKEGNGDGAGGGVPGGAGVSESGGAGAGAGARARAGAEASARPSGSPPSPRIDQEMVHIFTSHFFTKLTENHIRNFSTAYSKVQHWTRNVDLFKKKFVLVPVVQDMHWSLACLCNLDKLEEDKFEYLSHEAQPCMLFLDSLDMHYPQKIQGFLQKYLEEKWKESGRKAMDFDDDILPLVRPRVPTQINGCDCGVYVLRYAKEICRQWPTVTTAEVKDRLEAYFQPKSFSPDDIRDERRKLRELLQECKRRDQQERQSEKSKKDKGKAKNDGGGGSSGGSGSGSSGRDSDSSGCAAPGLDAEPSAPARSRPDSAAAAPDGSLGSDATPPPLAARADAKGAETSADAGATAAAAGGDVDDAHAHAHAHASSASDIIADGVNGGDPAASSEATESATELEDASGVDSSGADEAETTEEGPGAPTKYMVSMLNSLRSVAPSDTATRAGAAQRVDESDGQGENIGGTDAAIAVRGGDVAVSGGGGGGGGGSGSGSGDTSNGERGRRREGAASGAAVVDTTSSEEVPGSGGFRATGSCWRVAPPAPAPAEEQESGKKEAAGADSSREETGGEVTTGKRDVVAASGGGSVGEAAGAGDQSKKGPVRRTKKTAGRAARAGAATGMPTGSHEDESTADECRQGTGKGNGMEVSNTDGGGEEQRAELARETAGSISSPQNKLHKAGRPAPLQARGRNEAVPPTNRCKGTAGSGGPGATAITTATASASSSPSSSSRGGGKAAEKEMLIADENTQTPTKKKKRNLSQAPAAGSPAATAVRMVVNGCNFSGKQAADIVVLDADGEDTSGAVANSERGAKSSSAGTSSAPSPAGQGRGLERREAQAGAANAAATTAQDLPKMASEGRRRRVGDGSGNNLVRRGEETPAAAPAAAAGRVAATAETALNGAVSMGDCTDEGGGGNAGVMSEVQEVAHPPSPSSGAAGGFASAKAKGAAAHGSGKYQGSGGGDGDDGEGQFVQSMGERNKQRPPRRASAAAVAAAAAGGGNGGSGGRGREQQKGPVIQPSTPKGERQKRCNMRSGGQASSPCKHAKSPGLAIDLAGPECEEDGRDADVEFLSLVRPMTNGDEAEDREGQGGKGRSSKAAAVAGKKGGAAQAVSRPKRAPKSSKGRKIIEDISSDSGEDTDRDDEAESEGSNDY